VDSHRPFEVRRVQGAGAERRADPVAVEEPLEIRLAGSPLTVTMRTPGHDADLAAGFVVAEGILAPPQIGVIAACPEAGGNVVDVRPVDGVAVSAAPVRAYPAGSACGICGTVSIEQVMRRVPRVGGALRLGREQLLAMPGRLRAAQEGFERTGGLHAAGLFDAAGTLLRLREDVGRHNAVDKLVGASALRGELPLGERALLVSGRASFEIVQKAAAAGIPIVCAVSAPSSLAVELARGVGLTLVGFLRGDGFNVYAGEERIRS
jgi:FdhD protein